MIKIGDSLDLIRKQPRDSVDLIVTDPPYAFGGDEVEHALSATVAIVLRESARRLKKGRWMLVFCASSWRSTSYVVESVRGIVHPVRIAHWLKPTARTKTRTPGWQWGSIHCIAFRKGRGTGQSYEQLDHITESPLTTGRRARMPPRVARWAIAPFAVAGGVFLDPFAGSGVFVSVAESLGMNAIGFEQNRLPGEHSQQQQPSPHPVDGVSSSASQSWLPMCS
jgi:DNA modification methylase